MDVGSVLVLLLAACCSIVQSQYFYYYPTTYRRTYYYPVRTNCVNPCTPNNRYRWNYRPMAQPVRQPVVYPIVPQPIQPSIQQPPLPSPTPISLVNEVNATVASNPPDFLNPCRHGSPLANAFDSLIVCNYREEPRGGCPVNYWCHTGANYLTTACCPVSENVDPCKQPRVAGNGDSLIARWYFDETSKECKRFLYRGIQGNQNNFVMKQDCEDACESQMPTETNNPCRYGKAARVNNDLVVCGPSARNTCPQDYYCHIGESPETTVCCESSGVSTPCVLAMNAGQGKALITRFYFNTVAKRCAQFVYKGMRGNENNYLTLQSCQETCQKWDNPCPTLLDYGSRQECRPDVPNSCPNGMWCHVGPSQETTVCCPGAIIDPCNLSLDMGEGSASLQRWYVDRSDRSCTRQCKPFTYRGAKGNQNNFLSKLDCETACKPLCINPCSTSLLTDQDGTPRFCSPASLCPSDHYCHVGGDPESTVCCKAADAPCYLPLETGQGDFKLTRWYFNENLKKCTTFIYRGRNGNQNMFLTKQDCESVCPSYENPCNQGIPLLIDGRPKRCSPDEQCPTTHFCHVGPAEVDLNVCCPRVGNPCDMPQIDGIGEFVLNRFYYDKENHRCREFIYKGKQGNTNNFLSVQDCELTCPVYPNPCPQGEPLLTPDKQPIICGGGQDCPIGFWCHIGGSPEHTNCCPGSRRPCDFPVDEGAGDQQLERWYFDGSVQLCKRFTYRGMKGNPNNFLAKSDCRNACSEINPCAEGEPLMDSKGERVLCTGGQLVDSCPPTHFCHVGATVFTTICCLKKGDTCELPRIEGRGGEHLPRWYFDTTLNSCQAFRYGGLGGNENNFIARQTCEERCPAFRNFCPHGAPMIDAGKPATCGIEIGCPMDFICHMSSQYNVSICCHDPAAFCMQPRDPGPCDRKEIRFGYHAATDTCVPYDYGGCEGSLNNFVSLQRCTEICCKEFRRKA